MKKIANNIFSKDLEHLLSDIREVGIGNVIADSERALYKYGMNSEMSTCYALDYLLALVVENSRVYDRLYFWSLYVSAFRKFYGSQG